MALQKIGGPPGNASDTLPAFDVIASLGSIREQFLVGGWRAQPKPTQHRNQSRRKNEYKNQAAVHRHALQVPLMICPAWWTTASRPHLYCRGMASLESEQIDIVPAFGFP